MIADTGGGLKAGTGKNVVIAGFGRSTVSDIAVAREAARGLLKTPPPTTAGRRDRVANPAIRAMREKLAGQEKR